MQRTPCGLGRIAALLFGAACLFIPAPAGAGERDKDRVAIEKTSADFVSAFDRADAKALALMWTEQGEYVDGDGETFKGRAAIEKGFADFFEKNKGAKVQTKIEKIRFLSRLTAIEEGSLAVHLAGAKKINKTKYSVLHVLEDGKWLIAVVREWEDDGASQAKLSDLEWLIGSWSGKAADGLVEMKFTWNEKKTFIQGTYAVKSKDGASGVQTIGRDPVDDVLRSWNFGADGSIGHGVWFNDGSNWTIQSLAKMLDGEILTSTNLLNKTSADSFSWQSVDRRLDGAALPDTLPVRLERVKAK